MNIFDLEHAKEYNLAETLTDAVNGSFSKKTFIESMSMMHRTLQQKFTSLCLAWIKHVGSDTYRTDRRNEYSKEQCSKIAKFMDDNNITDFMPLI